MTRQRRPTEAETLAAIADEQAAMKKRIELAFVKFLGNGIRVVYDPAGGGSLTFSGWSAGLPSITMHAVGDDAASLEISGVELEDT